MIKFHKNSTAVAGFSLATALFLTACSDSGDTDANNTDASNGAPAEAVTIEFWHSASGASADIIRQLVEEFNAENDVNATVNEIYQGSYQDAIASLTNAVGTVDLPDVMQVTDTSTGFMYDSGLVTPIADLAEGEMADNIEDLVPIIDQYYTYDDKLQAMPFQVSMPVIYANDSLLEEAGLSTDNGPETVEELTEWAQTIKDSTGTAGLTLGLNSYWLEVMTSSAGELYCTPDNGLGGEPADAVNYSSDAQISQWTNMQEIIESEALLNVGQQGSEAQNAFGSETAGMLMASSGNLGNVSSMLPDGFTVYPCPIDHGDGGLAPSGNALWVIGQDKDDTQQSAAAAFVQFMGSPESQAKIFAATGYLPNSTAAIELARPEASPQATVILDQLESAEGSFITGGCHSGAMASLRSDAAQPAIDAIAAGNDVKATLESAEAEGSEVIARYNERAGL
ncbi:MAG: extracellular solute-binding protein [Corynebacterium sp.]|uniref:extracellular solute-binding protein n=1 Tax=Corynebacterium sp. TaxID=1720 RepID=UPI0026DFF146|nr:extracellular solute-binding protein [Corynebacterium sp.]MDO5670191.1 extracellular solute-binding protein [Corynebacterium sp.]